MIYISIAVHKLWCREVRTSVKTKGGQTGCSSRLIFIILPFFSRVGSVHSVLCLSRWSAYCLLCMSAWFCLRQGGSHCQPSPGNSTSSTTKARMGNVDAKIRSISWVKHVYRQPFRHHRQ